MVVSCVVVAACVVVAVVVVVVVSDVVVVSACDELSVLLASVWLELSPQAVRQDEMTIIASNAESSLFFMLFSPFVILLYI